MQTYQAATGIELGELGTTSVPTPQPRLRNLSATLDRAEQAYQRSVYQANTSTSVAFFATCAIAVATAGDEPLPMLGLLAIALLSAGSSLPLARYRFREEIARTARHEGLSALDARALATTMLSQWSASTHGATAMKPVK